MCGWVTFEVYIHTYVSLYPYIPMYHGKYTRFYIICYIIPLLFPCCSFSLFTHVYMYIYIYTNPDAHVIFTHMITRYIYIYIGHLHRDHSAHKTLSTNNPSYWDFSFAEMIEYDLPAMADYILTHSHGHSSLGLVGRSNNHK